jgi:hypothetical protein
MNKVLLILFSFLSISAFAQDDLMNMLEGEVEAESTPEKVIATFKGIKLINAQTIETTKKKTLEFRITHRFGNMGDAGAKHTLWGLENASNIRFSFDYGLTDKLSIGYGRSKMNEHIDLHAKFRFLEQKKGGIPISAAYYVNGAMSAVASIPNDDFNNRLSYVHQLIIASKLNKAISLEILPTLVHRNYVDHTISSLEDSTIVDQNNLISIGFAGRFKITKRLAFVVDYFLTISDFRTPGNGFYDPLSIGVEIETGGHVFHINISNSAGIIENDFLPSTRSNWGDGEYKLGFNISRVFSF